MSEKSFDSENLRTWRTYDLSESFRKTLDHIEEYGCEILAIAPDRVTPSFGYTVGAFDTGGRAELITVGLNSGVAHRALNEAVRLMRKGVDLTKGRHRELVGEVEVEFHPVHPAWLHHIMLRTDWYYGPHNDVPVLQLIYPDLQNRFPDEPDFDVAFEQPNLSVLPDNPESTAKDLWLAYDDSSSLSRWKFPCGPHSSAYLSETVHSQEEAITYVSHDEDGDWQFLGNRMSDGGGPVLTCLHHPIDEDRSLEELHDLPFGWYAVRDKPGDPWQRFEHPPAEQEAEQPAEPPLLH